MQHLLICEIMFLALKQNKKKIVKNDDFPLFLNRFQIKGRLSSGERRDNVRDSEWVGAPVSPLPQLPIEERGKRRRPGLFIYNSGSCYSCGKEPVCGRLQKIEKSNMQAVCCQTTLQERRDAENASCC